MITIDIIELLDQVAQQINQPDGIAIYHGTAYEQNKEAEEITYPHICIEEPLTSRETIRAAGSITIAYQLRLLFVTKSTLDSTPQQQRPLILSTRALARQFLTQAIKHTYNDGRRVFDISNGLEYTLTDIVDLMYDAALTGVRLEIELPVFEYNGNCLI